MKISGEQPNYAVAEAIGRLADHLARGEKVTLELETQGENVRVSVNNHLVFVVKGSL